MDDPFQPIRAADSSVCMQKTACNQYVPTLLSFNSSSVQPEKYVLRQTLDTKTTEQNPPQSKADKYPTSHVSPFNCCISVVL